MLKQEAQWLGSRMARLPAENLFPLLNVGSSTKKFRAEDQPWIDEEIFNAVERRGKVFHIDMKAAPGVDIVGDLNDESVRAQLKAVAPRSVFCSNLLEHVTDREGLASRLFELVAPGGYLILSVPHAFPYHPDPIDTLYRPGMWELASLFPQGRAVDGEIVSCGTVLGLLDRNVMRITQKVAGMVLSRPAPKAASSSPGLLAWLNPWLVKQFQVTCLIIEKPAS